VQEQCIPYTRISRLPAVSNWVFDTSSATCGRKHSQ